MQINDLLTLFVKVVVSSLGAVGILEYLKNFIKPEKTTVFSILMPIFATLCYIACELLPVSVIGSILSVGTVQLNYQIIIQGFKKIVESKLNKMEGDRR